MVKRFSLQPEMTRTMKYTTLLLLLLFALPFLPEPVSAATPKSGSITGKIIDQTAQEPVIGAVIECSPADSTKKLYTTSDKDGAFTFPKLAYGSYDVTITYLGLTSHTSQVEVAKPKTDLGTITMTPDIQQMDEIVVKGLTMRTTQKGDTLVYNAGAFKVTPDASTEKLLEKMPGIKVEGGSVEAQGEQVKKVLVDGKEFFGEDVTTAIKNLPAEVIDRVEVFDKLSDQAAFSGVDDGQGYKAINIVTQRGLNHAKFGRFYGSYGFDELYNVSASINLLKDNRRLTLLGMANNVNQQNFATDDLLGVLSSGGGRGGRGGRGGNAFMIGNQSGVSTVKMFGVDYANQWWDKLKVQGSYSFNTTKNTTEALTQREYFSDQLYDETGRDNSRNFNHRINGLVEYKINDNNQLMFRPSLSFQTNDTYSADTSATAATDGDAGNTLLNFFKSNSAANSAGYNISGDLNFMHKFGGRDGRVLTVSINGGASKNDRDNTKYSLTRYLNPDSTSQLNQLILNHSKGYRVGGRVSYSEPVSERVQLLANYDISYNYSDRDKRSYELPGDLFLDSLSNTYNSGYLTHRVGPGFRLHSDKTMLVINLNYQYATLTGDQQFPTVSRSKMAANFDNIVYMAMLHLKFNRSNSMRVRLFSGTDNPSVTQLQNVLDVSNPLFISQGNPNLKSVYAQRMNIRYTRVNVGKGTTLGAQMTAGIQNNSITNSVERADRNGYEVKDETGNTVVVLDRGAQYSRPVNLNGYWTIDGGAYYGFPVGWLGSNLNLDLRASYTAMPTIYNLVRSTTTTASYTGGITLGSNFSDQLDFTFTYRAGYNIAHSTNNNEYFNGVGTGRIKWITWKGITLEANGSYSKYRGVTDKFTEEFFLLNAGIGKKLFKNQRGEISVQVYDILNQNKSFVRNVSENYIQNVTTNVLGRYVSISLVYNLRTLTGKDGKAYSRPEGRDDFRRDGPPPGDHPTGPPRGGGMPPF